MSNYIEKYSFNITMLTPVHISDGYDTEIIPVDYVIDEKSKILYRIDLTKVEFDPEDRSSLNNVIEKNDLIEIRNFLQKIWKNKKHIFNQSICYSMNSEDIFDLYNNLQKEDKRLQLVLNTFIRNNNKKYLPGSSVKGAIRTALIESMLDKEIDDSLEEDFKQLNEKSIKLEAMTLNYWGNRNKPDLTKDPLKSLKISDSDISCDGIVKKIEIIKKENDKDFTFNSNGEIKIFKEMLPINHNIKLDILFDKRYFKHKAKIGKVFSFNSIIESCKKFYSEVLEHEKGGFFNEFDSKVNGADICDLYDQIKDINNVKGCFVLRLGHGLGRNSLSFNIKNKKGIEPNSRKLVKINGLYFPLGWIKVEVS